MVLQRAVIATLLASVICVLGSFALARVDAPIGLAYGLGILCTTLVVVRTLAPHVGFDRPSSGPRQIRTAPRSGHHPA